ncbi:MAG: CDF family Co(II)/Ni(II) efflux transporter DmeF [Rhodospirillaceae bacterium]
MIDMMEDPGANEKVPGLRGQDARFALLSLVMTDATHPCREPHRLVIADQGRNAGRTRVVLILTLIMMVAEISAGWMFGSMALLADGWHMSTHAAVLGIAVFAYSYARRHATNAAYTFGTGKIGDLAAFTSAILLAVVAVLMAVESFQRLAAPVAIDFGEAMAVAVAGLVVNIISAWLLRDDHSHGHDHGHKHTDSRTDHYHEHHHHHRDHNREAAYAHVVADALTSVFAIVALAAGMLWGLAWMDPAMGVLGALIISRWAYALARSSGRVLLDATPTDTTAKAVRRAIESDGDARVTDLHVWRIAPGQLAAVLTVAAQRPQTSAHYRARLSNIENLSHTTIEVEAA